jgi:thiamine-phosphate pyrophosphorylase
MLPKVQYISQGVTAIQQLRHIKTVLDLGYKWVQLRFKQQEVKEIASLAEEVKLLCDSYQSLLIINDHPRIARQVDADGVHLGLTDMGVAEARTILAPGKIIGGTANTLQDVRLRIAAGCRYIGLGPYRFTPTKEKLSPVLGLEGYKAILAGLTEQEKAIPVYAIGGILEEDIKLLRDAGVYGVAVSGLLTNNPVKVHW